MAGSQAGSYGALIAGGILVVAGFSGHSVRDVLAGKSSPLRGFISSPPEGNAELSSFVTNGQGANPAAATPGLGAKSAVEWAKSVLGTSGGSGAVARWDNAIGQTPGIPWCSAFIAAALRNAGVTNLPSNPAYSGAWINWSGGKKLPINSKTINEPGNLLIFDWGDGGITDHVAMAIGSGKMISGNDSNDKVGESSIPTSNIVAVIRPKYPRTSKPRLKTRTI